MLDRRFIRENPQAVKDAVRVKGIGLDVDELLSLDQASRDLQRELDDAQARRRSFAREFARADEETRIRLRAEHEEQDAHLKEVREELAEVSEKLQALMLQTPTIPWEGSPVGAIHAQRPSRGDLDVLGPMDPLSGQQRQDHRGV